MASQLPDDPKDHVPEHYELQIPNTPVDPYNTKDIKLVINGTRLLSIRPSLRITVDPSNFSRVTRKSHRAIKKYNSIRIIADIPTAFIDWVEVIASVRNLISPFFASWITKPGSGDNDPANKVQLIAVSLRSGRSYAAIDINNHAYDVERGHLQDDIFPVYMLRLSRTISTFGNVGKWKLYRHEAQDVRVMKDLKVIHLNCGIKETPLLDDKLSVRWPSFDIRK